MRLKLLSLITLSQLSIPLAQIGINMTSIGSSEILALEEVEYVWMSPEFYFGDFVINRDNFEGNWFVANLPIKSDYILMNRRYIVEVTVINGNGVVYDKTNSSNLYFYFIPQILGNENNGVKLILDSYMFDGLTTIHFDIYANDLSLYSFSFQMCSYYSKAIMYTTETMKVIYEVEFTKSHIITRYETLEIVGIESLILLSYYRNVPFNEFEFIYKILTRDKIFDGIYYFVLDEDEYLDHILDEVFVDDKNFKGTELNSFENGLNSFTVKTKTDFYLDASTYKMSKSRSSEYSNQVNTIYFPKENFDTFSDTDHIFYIENFGLYGFNIYYKFHITMDHSFIEDNFLVEGGYGKLLDDYYQEEVAL